MDWKDIGKVVKKVAPVLGGIIGGPPGAALGTGVSLLASVLGVESEDPQPEEIMQAITGDPEALIKIKQMELTSQVQLQQLLLEETRAFLADRANARARETAIVEATGGRDWTLYALGGGVVTGFFVLCVVLMKWPLPEGSSNVVLMLFGALSAGFGTVLQYFFGSSKSSTQKTALLANGARK